MLITEPTTDWAVGRSKAHNSIHKRGLLHGLLGVVGEVFTTPRGWWLICICVALAELWPHRYFIITDGLSYLDIASEASNGDLSALGNTYWSPAYPALIGTFLFFFRPSPAWELPLVHFVNLLIFILALGSFTFFFRQWSMSIPEYEQAGSRAKGFFTLFAFASFLWFTRTQISFQLTTPDMLVAAMVFSVAAMGCRVSRPRASWKHFIALGVLLGTGIYVKAALFPLAVAFIAFLFLSLARSSDIPRTRQLAYLAVTALLCVVVATPLIVFMSIEAGRVTTGDAGKLNYLWHADGFEPSHLGWTGGTAPQFGTPLHAPRVLMENPTVLEFARPIAGTYPLWHSPAYWYAGAKTAFSPRQQVIAVKASLREYKNIAILSVSFIAGAILLFVLSMLNPDKGHAWGMSPWLVAWSLAACAMYAAVSTEQRYVAVYLLILCLEVYRSLIFRVERRAAVGVCAVVLLVAMAPIAVQVARSVEDTVRLLRHPVDSDWVVLARNIRQMGLQPGDQVAVVGYASNCYYARYDRLRVVAEILAEDDFWRLDPAGAKLVEDRLASINVKALIALNRPVGNHESGWTYVGRNAGTPVSIHLLTPVNNTAH